MKYITSVLTVLAAAGALAEPQPNAAYQSNGYNYCNGGYGSSLPVINAQIQTSTVENPTVGFSSFTSPSTISGACHCLQTLVRPQIRNELITVPAVDRIVRTVPGAPVVETVNCGGTTRLTTFNPANGLQPGSRGQADEGRGSSQSTSGINVHSLFGGGSTAAISHNPTNTANRVTATLVATPTSVFTFQPSGGSVGGYSNTFSGTSGYSNTGRINPY